MDIVIYLKAGEEIIAYDLQMDTKNISFKKKKGKKAEKFSFPKEKVFLIKYPDGTRDIISEFQNKRSPISKGSNTTSSSNIPVKQTKALIKTTTGATIEAIIVKEEGGIYSYLKNGEVGPLYQISKDNIKSLEYIR